MVLLTVFVSVRGAETRGLPSEVTRRTLSTPFQSRIEDGAHAVVFVDAADPRALQEAIFASRSGLFGFVPAGAVVTPRLVEHALSGARLAPRPLLVVPGYELDVSAEAFLGRLEEPHWDGAPYDVFESSRFGRTNEKGFLCNLWQASAFFCTREMLEHVPSFETAEALYAALLNQPENRLVVLGGEGAFFEAGAPQPAPPETGPVNRIEREPLLFGVISGQAHEPLRLSIGPAALREMVTRRKGFEPFTFDRAVPRSSAAVPARAPVTSIVVVGFAIPRQLENTLHSLSARYQCNVAEDDYEIVVVENRSSSMLGEARARAVAPNIRYFEHDERGVSPAPALNLGIREARGSRIGLMIDGARMVSPRLVEHATAAFRVYERPIVVVPGYDLGPGQQHLTASTGYDEEAEQRLLEGIDWKRNGYRLFEVSCLDEATQNGFLNPLLESTCLFVTRSCLEEIGGLDERFDQPGGGIVNQDLFERLCRLPRTRYLVLWGEGTFHQFHGSVSRDIGTDRAARLVAFSAQYILLRGHEFKTYEREPVLLGTCSAPGATLLADSVWLGHIRYGMVRSEGRPEWENG